MKRILMLVILVAVPLLMAGPSIWTNSNPTNRIKHRSFPRLPALCPLRGKEIISQESELRNPTAPTAASLSQGKTLFFET